MTVTESKLDSISKSLNEISTLLKNLVLIQNKIAENLKVLSHEAKSEYVKTSMKGMVDEDE